jgi:hypothetical protein
MYQIYAKSRSVEKDFEKLLGSLSKQQHINMMTVLATSPKATQASGAVLNKIEKRGRYWQYFATGGDRVIFDVIETKDTKQVLILFAGNHDKAKIFLREQR